MSRIVIMTSFICRQCYKEIVLRSRDYKKKLANNYRTNKYTFCSNSCSSKYQWRRHIEGGEFLLESERFWIYVNKTPGLGTNGDCWEWLGKPSRKKYGYGVYSENSKSHPAHRYSYELANGQIKDKDMKVCHKCDNSICVNPDHLFLGTQRDNIKDMISKKRDAFGSKANTAKLSDGKVIFARRLYATGCYTKKRIANILEVSETTAADAINYKSWKHVLPERCLYVGDIDIEMVSY